MRQGSHHSAEAIERIRASAKAQVCGPTWRQRHRAAMAAPAVRQRISGGTKAAYEVPGMRERKRASLVAAYADPELRRKVSEATKQGMARWRVHQLDDLRAAWLKAPKDIRAAFLTEIGAAIDAGTGS